MKKAMVAIVLASMMAVLLAGCGSNNDSAGKTSASSSASSASVSTPSFSSAMSTSTSSSMPQNNATYESVLEEYTAKLQEQAPILVAEYNDESVALGGDISALAELSNAKITELAETSNEGMSKMADLMLKNGDDYSTYEEWANQLTDVYMQEAQKITDAYMASAI